jgi:hypothetical protein
LGEPVQVGIDRLKLGRCFGHSFLSDHGLERRDNRCGKVHTSLAADKAAKAENCASYDGTYVLDYIVPSQALAVVENRGNVRQQSLQLLNFLFPLLFRTTHGYLTDNILPVLVAITRRG